MNSATNCLRQRLLLLLALLPLIAATAGLIYGSHLNARRNFYWDNAQVLWMTQPGGRNWQWDVRADDWKRVSTKPDRQYQPSDGPIELTLLDADKVRKPTSRWLARVRRPDGSGQRDEIEFKFPAYPAPIGRHFVTEDGKVQSVSLDVSVIETRDTLTAEVVAKQPIPSDVNRVIPAFSWGKDFLLEARRDSKGFLFEQVYDLTTGQPLPLSPATIQQLPRLESHGLWMFVGETWDGYSTISVYNKLQHAVIWQGVAGPGCLATFLDESRIALADRRHGVTVQVIDIHSGRQLAHTRPWWWVSPLLVACSVCFVVWVFFWVRAAPRHHAWIAFDVSLLALLGIAPLLLRLFELNDHTDIDIDRLLFAYLQGLFVALAHLCGVWIVLGRSQRWLWRCVPLTLVVVVLLALLTMIFKPSTEIRSLRSFFVSNNEYAWEGLMLTLLPTLVSMFCFAMMVAIKFRFVRQLRSTPTSHDAPLMWHDAPRRDMPSDSPANSRRGASCHIGQLPLRDIMLAYSNNRKLFYMANAFAAVVLIAIIALPAIDFAEQVVWSFQFIRWRKFFLVSAVSLVWFYAFLLIFRYRCRLRWA